MAQRIAVLGAGVMGSEIAYAAAAAGVDVALFDADPEALERGVAHAASIGERRVARGRMEADEASAIAARIHPTTEDADLAGCDIGIEAVPERMDIKRTVMARLDAALPEGALIASNTSGLSISEMAAETGRPERVLGLHFFNPASVMKLVEVVEGAATSEETMVAGEEFASALGKTPVRVRECPGFLVNRILCRAMVEAYRHAADIGADPAAADAAVAEDGPAPMGPFALGDLIGLDTMAHLRKDLGDAYGDRFGDAGQIDAQVEQGRLGLKSGAGFFDGKPPEAAADDAGREVAERYYLGALHEAYLCLEENVAAREDVDVAVRLGCGWETGPLAWAADEGLAGLVARMEALAGDAPRLSPPDGLTAASAR